MPQVELTAKVFEAVNKRAADASYTSVDEYVSDLILGECGDTGEDIGHLFTPDRLALISQTLKEVGDGSFLPIDAAFAQLEKRKVEWLKKNPAAK